MVAKSLKLFGLTGQRKKSLKYSGLKFTIMVIFNYVIKDEEIIGIGPLSVEAQKENKMEWVSRMPPKERLPFRFTFMVYTKQNGIKISSELFYYAAGIQTIESGPEEIRAHEWQLQFCSWYEHIDGLLTNKTQRLVEGPSRYIEDIRERSLSEIRRIKQLIKTSPSES